MTTAQTKFLENAPFLAALTSAIEGRETSKDKLSAKDELPALVHVILVEGQNVKVRIATDSRCSAVNEFLQKYSDEALQLSQTSSTRRLLLKGEKISSLFMYEVKVAPVKSSKLVVAIKELESAVVQTASEQVYAPIPEFNTPEAKPTKVIRRSGGK